MTRAIRNLMGQQCWARSMIGVSLNIVEPFSSESKLVHYRRFWDALKSKRLHNAVLFGEYFDMDYYNNVSVKEKSSPLIGWNKFLSDNKTPRKVAVVSLPTSKCAFGSSPHNIGARLKIGNQKLSCFYGKPLNNLIEGLRERFNITLVKRVCLECAKLTHKLKLNELQNMIFGDDSDHSQYIVLMNTWRNFAFTQNWLEVPDYCKLAEDPKSSERLTSSNSVAEHSQKYKEEVIKSDRVVAVMFRIERFLTLKVLGKSDESLSSCLEKTVQLHDKLVQEGAPKKSGTFVTLDIGRFGSKLMQTSQSVAKYGQNSLDSINKSVHDMIAKIYRGQFQSIEDWEDSFVRITGGITERGYISMVQRTIATDADCLIVMGGGSYQQVAISQYLSKHPDPSSRCLHAVCVAENILNMLHTV